MVICVGLLYRWSEMVVPDDHSEIIRKMLVKIVVKW